MERTAHALGGNGQGVDNALLQYLSPLGWEHINLPGAYPAGIRAKLPLQPLQLLSLILSV